MLILLLSGVYAEEVGKIVAKVNNDVITAKDLTDYYRVLSYQAPDTAATLPKDEKLAKKEALERLIEDKLILSEAKKLNIEVFPYLINNQLEKIMASYPSREAFESSLVERGINVTLLKERIKGQYLMRQLITDNVSSYITVSPQEISKYYQEHAAEINSGKKYSIWMFKTKDKNLLSQVAKAAKAKGFDQIKQEYGNSFVNLEATTNDLSEDAANLIQGIKEGESVVTKVGDEHIFIYLEKIIPPRQLSLEEANEKIYGILWDKKFKERFQQWMKELKAKALIAMYL
jgi:peptidyl-prolyl cis-trans isomerase SurA